MLELATFLEPYKLAFQELYRLVYIALTLPVSSASCERSFSAMKLIKSYLHSIMCDSRLSNIAVLSIESSRAESLSLDAFVDEFDAIGIRIESLLCISCHVNVFMFCDILVICITYYILHITYKII